MNLSETALIQALTSLCDSQIKTDGTFSVSLYSNPEATEPECTHTWHGGGKHSLMRGLCLIALITASCAVIRCLCRLCARH